jgi:hypothetical protein
LKANKNILSGILWGAICGILFSAVALLALHASDHNGGTFRLGLRLASGHFIETNASVLLVGLSWIAALIVGVLRARNVSFQTWKMLLAFVVGVVAGVVGLFFFGKAALKDVPAMYEYYSSEREAEAFMVALKAIDHGTTNHFQFYARSSLTNYIREVEKLQKEDHYWLQNDSPIYKDIREYLFPFLFDDPKERDLFWNKMIPSAEEFVQRNELPFAATIGTNNISSYSVELYRDRPGGDGAIRLNNGYIFHFVSDGTNVGIQNFHALMKTEYDLTFEPKEKVEAIKALILQNKLNDERALELAKKFFKLQGHKDENFHPPELRQTRWMIQGGSDGPLPYYEITWYRKDVNLADLNKGSTGIPEASMTISGVDSGLIYYSRSSLPIGSDF